MYDVVIIGAGPAGLAAALYLLRFDKSVLLLEKGAFGGQITYSPLIENYPGIAAASGNEIAEKLVDQVLSLGAEAEVGRAVGLRPKGRGWEVLTEEGIVYEGGAVILALGARHRTLGLAGEEAWIGNGLSFCAVCDGAFYKGKDVVVIGGGNSAKQEALFLSGLCRQVTMVQNLSALTGEPRLTAKVLATPNINVLYDSVVTAYAGDTQLRGVTVKNTLTGESQTLATDGVFVAIGLEPDCKDFASFLTLDEAGYVASGEDCTTKTPGLFVAGDCRAKAVRQITTAVADGAVAALAAASYLDAQNG